MFDLPPMLGAGCLLPAEIALLLLCLAHFHCKRKVQQFLLLGPADELPASSELPFL